MKDIAEALINELSAMNAISCDWYTLTLQDGRVFRMVDSDRDVYVDNNIWYHNAALLKREQVKIQSEVVVDTMTITVTVGRNDHIGTDSVLKAAHDGVLDRAVLTFGRAWFADAKMSELLGAITLFSGRTEVKKAGGLELSLSVKANTQGLNMEFPIRRYYPQGTYAVVGGTVIDGDGSEGTCVIAPFVPRKEVLL